MLKKILLIIIAIAVITVLLFRAISNRENLYSSIGGTIIGFLGAFLIYQIGIMFDEKQKQKLRKDNTKYIYQLYKIEIEMNKKHINDLMQIKRVPYFKLKTITRDKLWGELADYSKDIRLMNKLNGVYGEFELINNKIDLMIAARLANMEKSKVDKSNELEGEILEQLKGVIDLGKGVLSLIDECLGILDTAIKN